MKKLLLCLTFIAFILFSCSFPENSLSNNYENWMYEIFPEGNAALSEIIIPGTHDSGTYSMDMNSDYAVNYELMKAKPSVLAWSKTQSFGSTIGKQLKDGIRYIDLRVEYFNNKFYTFHGLRSAGMDEIILDIDSFAKQHPQEVFIIHFQDLDMNSDEIEILADWIEENSNIPQRSADLSIIPPDSKLSAFRNAEKNIIILWDKNTTREWQNSEYMYISNPWANSSAAQEVCEFISERLSFRDTSSTFFVSQTVVTTDAETVVCGWWTGRSSLMNLTEIEFFPEYEKIINRLISETADKSASPNIFIADFYEQSRFVELCIEANR